MNGEFVDGFMNDRLIGIVNDEITNICRTVDEVMRNYYLGDYCVLVNSSYMEDPNTFLEVSFVVEDGSFCDLVTDIDLEEIRELIGPDSCGFFPIIGFEKFENLNSLLPINQLVFYTNENILDFIDEIKCFI